MPDKVATAPEKEPLKQKLIRVAEEILESQGLEALTLRAAARAAGVSHMAPYRHFDDKEALLAAVSTEGFKALANAMDAAVESLSDPQRRMGAIGIAYVSYALQYPARYRLMFGPSIADKRRFKELIEAGDQSFARCRAMMGGAASEHERADDDLIERRAIAIWSIVHGLASLLIDRTVTLPGPDEQPIEERILAILQSTIKP